MREKQHIRAIYDSNVSYQDELIGKLIARLEAWGVWDQTMLVLTADHGDELWESGRVGHEVGQDETLLHVPLLIHYPPLFPAARIRTRPRASISCRRSRTRSASRSATSGRAPRSCKPPTAARRPLAWPPRRATRRRRRADRPVEAPPRGHGCAVALLLLTADPDEQRNLFGTRDGVIGGRLVLDAMSLLRAQHAAWKKARWGNPANVTARFAADLGE